VEECGGSVEVELELELLCWLCLRIRDVTDKGGDLDTPSRFEEGSDIMVVSVSALRVLLLLLLLFCTGYRPRCRWLGGDGGLL